MFTKGGAFWVEKWS